MKTNLLRNRYVVVWLTLYAASLALLHFSGKYSAGEALTILLVIGAGFSVLAWLSSRSASPLDVDVHPSRTEMLVLMGYVLFISLYLVWGSDAISGVLLDSLVHSPRISFLLNLAKKLIVFVALPLWLFHALFGYSLRQFGFPLNAGRAVWKSHAPVVVIMSAGLIAFQFFVGTAAAPLRAGQLTIRQLLIGLPLCFMWLSLEVGLVEEFFFRALLQSRLAAYFGSETTGVALMSLIFGFSHVPGFVLRQSGAVEALGAAPSVWEALAYSVVVLSMSGIFFGIIWARTRNLPALMLIHAAADLLPNVTEFIRIWNIK